MKRVLKISINEWENSSRDIRELNIAKELGAEIIVMAKNKYNKRSIEIVDGFKVYRIPTKPLGNISSIKVFNQILSLLIWAYYARRFKAQIISGHNYIPVFIGWLSNIGKIRKSKLIYDSHEFELGTYAATHKSKLNIMLISRLEKFLINRSSHSIMVNDSIAKEVKSIHNLKFMPIVIRNVTNTWQLNNSEIEIKRVYFHKYFKIDSDTVMVMFHGGLFETRGIENFLKAISITPKSVAIILGNGTPEYLKKINALIQELKIEKRVLLHKAVPINELYKYVAAADVGIFTPLPVSINHKYTLPNKFFENIQALNPIICSDFPEIGGITKAYNIGLTCDPENISSISNAITEMRTNHELYNTYKKNLLKAKADLSWEKERNKLINIYSTLLKD